MTELFTFWEINCRILNTYKHCRPYISLERTPFCTSVQLVIHQFTKFEFLDSRQVFFEKHNFSKVDFVKNGPKVAKMENTDSLNRNQLLTRMYTKMEEGGWCLPKKVSFSNPLLSQQYLFNRQSTS